MIYEVHIKGVSPLIMHNGAAGLDTRSPANVEKAEITKKRGTNRTIEDEARLRELECQTALWLDEKGGPTIPTSAFRAMIETSAKKLKQGPLVREGLMVDEVTEFKYDKRKGNTAEELGKTCQFTVGVVVQRNRVLRTRAIFDPWAAKFIVYLDPELCDIEQLHNWLGIGGQRIGIGDWRPEKSGVHGRFEVVSVKGVKQS